MPSGSLEILRQKASRLGHQSQNTVSWMKDSTEKSWNAALKDFGRLLPCSCNLCLS